jgi:hypothetical protein
MHNKELELHVHATLPCSPCHQDSGHEGMHWDRRQSLAAMVAAMPVLMLSQAAGAHASTSVQQDKVEALRKQGVVPDAGAMHAVGDALAHHQQQQEAEPAPAGSSPGSKADGDRQRGKEKSKEEKKPKQRCKVNPHTAAVPLDP